MIIRRQETNQSTETQTEVLDNTELVSSNQEIIRDEQGRFIKGVSGNPSGRPVDTLAKHCRAIMKEVGKTGRPGGEDFVRFTLAKAYEGDSVAMKIIWNYHDGMPTQTTELTGKDGADLPAGNFVSQFNYIVPKDRIDDPHASTIS